MARRSLRPHLNQIRAWVRQGRTDAWVAHQLDVTVQQIETFKRENDLAPDGADAPAGETFDDEVDLRAEDDALIAVELEKAEAEAAKKAEEKATQDAEKAAQAKADGDESGDEEPDDDNKPARRRGRRGGRGRRRGPVTLEGSFDHGDEGYGLWLDPAVADDAIYAEHWAGHRPVEVTVEADQIVIRRAGEPAGEDD
jgi:hypothetical protein